MFAAVHCPLHAQIFNIDPNTGLRAENATGPLRLLVVAAGAGMDPPGDISGYFYIDSAATYTWAQSALFAFTTLPRGQSDLASQTFYWYLVTQLIPGEPWENGLWTVMRFTADLPATDPIACPTTAKSALAKLQLTYDVHGIYVTGILLCFDIATRAISNNGPLLYVLPQPDTSDYGDLSQYAVFTVNDFVSSLPEGSPVVESSFLQMQPARPQSLDDIYPAEEGTPGAPFVTFVGQVCMQAMAGTDKSAVG
jgi:hypothetical protein